ncbi:site-specific integrase [Saccharophagus degradans]|uniref:tyrosine-type recombinase/integrase n=1 Tax=Saccharophagus degradans TaxID=86304 RepID=UPI00247820A6|nr:site-specific integrase [Saccharophagus degradans]WGO96560.1 site-specific integrase [Saccharophagus degradans]
MPTPTKPIPLYPTLNELRGLILADYPEVKAFLEAGPSWRMQHWLWGLDFLKYIARSKSEHTFSRFRNETERFLIWSFLVKEKPIDEYRKADILDYADFCWQPPVGWISFGSNDRFFPSGGYYKVNPDWLPFRLKLQKNEEQTPDKKRYRPSQETLAAMFTGINAFYRHLMNEEYCYGNPSQIARTDCPHMIRDAQVKEIRRLTEDQWAFVVKTAEQLADKDHKYERSLFVVVTLKTLFLRISELSERRNWIPEMSHFWQDHDENWWLKIYGKGRKVRDVTVPTEYFPYLKRYRAYRGQSALPSPGDHSPLVEKLRGQGGMTARHLTRLVQEVFDVAYSAMAKSVGEEKAKKLKEASTHWLRHTGASMEIERGRELKDVSEDLGHASMATTDTIYVQSETKKRAESGKGRKV